MSETGSIRVWLIFYLKLQGCSTIDSETLLELCVYCRLFLFFSVTLRFLLNFSSIFYLCNSCSNYILEVNTFCTCSNSLVYLLISSYNSTISRKYAIFSSNCLLPNTKVNSSNEDYTILFLY